VEEAAAAIRDGRLVVLPTDTVYGLACAPEREGPVRLLSELKGRPPDQPIALVAASLDALLALVPELTLLNLPTGPYTFVVPNPARRLPWLAGARPDAIGVRLPELAGPGRELLEAVGTVAATSANLHGEPDPRRLDEVPDEILRAVAAVVDGGELPGTPSTVVDLTGVEPVVLREGAVPAAEALARVVRSPSSAQDPESASTDPGSREDP
jgi:L-threonylcarbamoyladenylate synthase